MTDERTHLDGAGARPWFLVSAACSARALGARQCAVALHALSGADAAPGADATRRISWAPIVGADGRRGAVIVSLHESGETRIVWVWDRRSSHRPES